MERLDLNHAATAVDIRKRIYRIWIFLPYCYLGCWVGLFLGGCALNTPPKLKSPNYLNPAKYYSDNLGVANSCDYTVVAKLRAQLVNQQLSDFWRTIEVLEAKSVPIDETCVGEIALLKGVVELQEKQFDRSSGNLLLATKILSDDWRPFFFLWICLQDMGRKDEAKLVKEKGMKLNPKPFEEYWSVLGGII